MLAFLGLSRLADRERSREPTSTDFPKPLAIKSGPSRSGFDLAPPLPTRGALLLPSGTLTLPSGWLLLPASGGALLLPNGGLLCERLRGEAVRMA